MKFIMYPVGQHHVQGRAVRGHLYLSRRNVLALLTKLFTPDSACTIMSGNIVNNEGSFVYPKGEPPVIAVTIEEDAVHYTEEQRQGVPPGPVHPTTQALLTALQEIVDAQETDKTTKDEQPTQVLDRTAPQVAQSS